MHQYDPSESLFEGASRPQNSFLGLDVSKGDFHAALLVGNRTWSKSFGNNESGITQLETWLNDRDTAEIHACLESTGGFEETLALSLHERGVLVSVVNPSRIKAFAQSELLRTKTDAVDAALIARFCKAHLPDRWVPPAPESRALQALVRRYASIQDMLLTEKNRLNAARVDRAVERSLSQHVDYLEAELKRVAAEIDDLIAFHRPLCEQRNLLTTIPGIANLTAARILGEMPNISTYRNSRAVAAFAGLSPREHQSGIFRGRTRLAKTGNSRLRRRSIFQRCPLSSTTLCSKRSTSASLPPANRKSSRLLPLCANFSSSPTGCPSTITLSTHCSRSVANPHGILWDTVVTKQRRKAKRRDTCCRTISPRPETRLPYLF
jgi:transposase